MIVLYILILLLSLIGIRKQESSDLACSKEQSAMIKGIFVLLVFTSHIGGYLDLSSLNSKLEAPYELVRTYLGQMIVVPFLFYSGYGIRSSIEKKGKPYIKAMPYKRVFRTYIHAAVIVAVFLMVTLLLGTRYTGRHILSAFLLWGSLGNSNWYLFAILSLYLFTWFSFRVF